MKDFKNANILKRDINNIDDINFNLQNSEEKEEKECEIKSMC